MTPEALLLDLERLGVELTDEGGRLRWRAPAGVVRQDLQAALASHKAQLLDLLARLPCRDCGRRLDARGACWSCGRRRCARCPHDTGSPFIELCGACEMDARRQARTCRAGGHEERMVDAGIPPPGPDRPSEKGGGGLVTRDF